MKRSLTVIKTDKSYDCFDVGCCDSKQDCLDFFMDFSWLKGQIL